MFPCKANAVFLAMAPAAMEALRRRGWRFYTFIGGAARFMFAWDTVARVRELVEDLRLVGSTPDEASATIRDVSITAPTA